MSSTSLPPEEQTSLLQAHRTGWQTLSTKELRHSTKTRQDIKYFATSKTTEPKACLHFHSSMKYPLTETGDGQTDDTKAINRAISDGSRFSPESRRTSSTTPAIVYFPEGTYVISRPIIDYYFTQLVGNPNSRPVIKATAAFEGMGLIDGDQYQNDGNQGWTSTNVFFRQVRNFVLDLTDIPPNKGATGIHWPTGQASSLYNIKIVMSSASGSQHQGLFIENGMLVSRSMSEQS